MRIPPSWRQIAVFFFLIVAGFYARQATGQGVFVPLTTRQDMVFDHAGKYLYITTSDGWVRRFNLSTKQLDLGYNLGGTLNGLDIAPDDSFLLVAQGNWSSNNGIFHKLDLATGAVTNLVHSLGAGAWDVAIAANGIALATSGGSSGWTPLIQIDLTTNAITARTDASGSAAYSGEVRTNARVARNADGTRLIVSEDGCFVYNALNDTFGPAAGGSSDKTPINSTAINPDGTLIATQLGFSLSIDTVQGFNLLHVFAHLGGGVAFDPIKDTLYATTVFSDEIIAYDTKSFAEQYRLPVGEVVEFFPHEFEGTLVISDDGLNLALHTPSGVRVFKTPEQPPPPQSPTFMLANGMVFDHAGKYLYLATETGWIWPYNLATRQLETPYNLGGILLGLDIAADDSFLIAAQYYRGLEQGTFHKLDLQTGASSNINFPFLFGENGAWAVAMGSNGLALATLHVAPNVSAAAVVRQIDPATSSVSLRKDAPGAFGEAGVSAGGGGGTQLHRSADGTRLLFLEVNISSGPRFTYNAVTDTFGPSQEKAMYWDTTSPALNRNGTLMAWGGGYGTGAFLETVPGFNAVQAFPAIEGALTFDAVSDVLYGVSPYSKQIIAYDTNTFAEKFRLNIGETMPVFPGPPFRQFDIGYLVASHDGRYLALTTPTTTRVFDIASGVVTALPTPPPPAAGGRLANLSTRAVVQTGDNVAIGGFIISGTASKKIIIRALGPSLAKAGVSGTLEDPTLEVYDAAGAIVASNDDWKISQTTPQLVAIVQSSLAPRDDREAAVFITLSPGAYTAVLRGKNNTTGVALVELYDMDPAKTSKLVNISTRAFVGTDDNVMIAGFIVKGASSKVVVRGIGPSLTQSNIQNALEDPILELHNGDGAIIASNDDWEETKAIDIWNHGLSPQDERESAILATLMPGNHTAVFRGQGNATGIGLVEVYALP